MVNKTQYSQDAVDACYAVMVELFTVLGEFRDNIVLVGGWIPYLLLEEKRDEHTASMDIDIALDNDNITDDTYATILQLLDEHGYEQSEKQPFIFYRYMPVENDAPIKVEIDLLSGEYGGTSHSHRTQRIQDVQPRKARGSDLAFDHYIEFPLTGTMPDGAQNEVKIKIAAIVPFLVMKGMALWTSPKQKHPYDIYFMVRHYPGGTDALVDEFEPFTDNTLVREGLGKIRTKFETVDDIGPSWITDFEVIDSEEERAQVKRDAFERVNAFLDKLEIEAFTE